MDSKQIKFNGQMHSFPSDFTDEEISQALGGGPTRPSVGQDIQNIPEYASKFAKAIPGELNAAYDMPLGRSLKNVAAGYLGLANIPHQAAEYYSSRHVPYLEKLIEHYPWKANLDPNKYLGLGEQQPGDLVYQSLGPSGPIKAGAEALGHGAVNAARGIPQVAQTAADIAPVLKFMERTPYRQGEEYMTAHNVGQDVNVNPHDLHEVERIMRSRGIELPEAAIENSFGRAHAGEHQALSSVQSSARTVGRHLTRRGGIEGDLGDYLHQLADNIHHAQRQHYENIGHPEMSEIMRRQMQRSRRYHKISPYRIIASGAALTAAASPRWARELLAQVIE